MYKLRSTIRNTPLTGCRPGTSVSFVVVVFKYLAEKYIQRLKQQTAEEPEVVHTTSNKIGTC
jgi:hypothetical protein